MIETKDIMKKAELITVRDLIKILIDENMDSYIYVSDSNDVKLSNVKLKCCEVLPSRSLGALFG